MAMVCLCNRVTERRVRRAISKGASTVDDVIAECGAGGGCTGCHPTIEQILDEPVAVRGLLAS